ncbi:MAG TPA: hypothetical protein VMJ93_00880 [Verrucomicrobiae bacterium]|nr:hypothetical protein [Verrucomicrobiae bacterium]
MWKLERAQQGNLRVLVLSGRIEQEQLADLKAALEAEQDGQGVVLDLSALKLVDRQVVKFLATCEISGIRLENCPRYIREWITRGKAGSDDTPSTELS